MALEIQSAASMLCSDAALLCGVISSAFSHTTELYKLYIFILMSIKDLGTILLLAIPLLEIVWSVGTDQTVRTFKNTYLLLHWGY